MLTGALLNDIGYLEQYHDNEQCAVRLTNELLPRYNYQAGQIEKVQQLIHAIKVEDTPRTLMESILQDADRDSLGRNDFFVLSAKLHRERTAVVGYISLKEWWIQQEAFLLAHHYYTEAARQSRDEQKKRNITELHNLLY